MDVGFLSGWAKEQGIKVPQKSDGSANINELFALYNEWKKKGGESKAERSDDSSNKENRNDKDDKPEVVELDENSELMRRVEGLSRKERVKAVENYLREVLGGKEITFHDGIKATVTGRDANKLAHDTYHSEKGERRTAELAEIEKLIGAARYVKDGEVEEHNRDRFSKFRYYGVTTRYKGNDEVLLLNVGKNIYTGKYQFYTITSGK